MGQLYSCASSEFEINSEKPSNIKRIALPHGIISHIHQGREENIKQCLNIFHNIKETPKVYILFSFLLSIEWWVEITYDEETRQL